MWALYKYVLRPAGGFAMTTVNPLIWGFNFLVGTAWAILFKNIGNKLLVTTGAGDGDHPLQQVERLAADGIEHRWFEALAAGRK